MTRYPFLDRHLPSFAAPLGWWLDGLATGQGATPVTIPSGVPHFAFVDGALVPQKGRFGSAVRKARQKGGVLVVPARQWLTLSVQLPPVGRAEHLRILALDLENRTPFSMEAAFFDVGAGGTAHVVPRAAISAALTSAEAQGLSLRWLLREGPVSAPAVIDRHGTSGAPFRKAKTVASLAITAIVMGAVYLGQLGWNLRNTLGVAQAELSQLAPMVARARALEAQAQATSSQARSDLPAVLLPNRPATHVLLEALTRATPDGSYLTDLQIDGDTIRLGGISDAPEALMRSLDASDYFTAPVFDGALQTRPEGTRFQIVTQIRGNGE